jgi:muramoyltetrapeptide carboxypeptidase
MSVSRRAFITTAATAASVAAAAASASAFGRASAAASASAFGDASSPASASGVAPVAAPAVVPASALVRPKRLRPGDVVGLIDPASATWEPVDVDIVEESLAALGLKAKRGPNLLNRRGYFAGTDEQRAADINAMFADREVKAIQCVRGGWGSARLLPLLDWASLARSPKILLGYSDITALLLSLHAKTGLVTFHGPVGVSPWNPFNVGWFKRVLLEGEAVTFSNLKEVGEDALTQIENRIQTITPGTARGRLLGGNLTVLTAIIGSGYLPAWDGSVLFIEDVQEAPYRIDRMLTQLKLAGILQKARAVIFGNCTKCDPGEGFGSLTITDVLRDHLAPLGVPAWRGAMIGHIERQFTLPIGVEVEVDATAGTIKMLEPAVID